MKEKETPAVKVLVLLQVIGHPRDSKRISMLKAAGFEVEAMAFERDYHAGRLPDCRVELLGKLENRRYGKRIFKLLAALPKIRKKAASFDVIYALGQDVAALGQLATLGMPQKVAIEVGDIVHLQLHPGFAGKIVRWLEQMFVKNYGLIVVISPGFLEDYYRGRLKIITPGLVLENKLELEVTEYPFPQTTSDWEKRGTALVDRPFRIGYFGLLRDHWSWEVLSQLAQQFPDSYEIWFAGKKINPLDLEERIADKPNMRYMGEYKSPHDLRGLYDSVDMVWACYAQIGEHDWNLRWGRPNRFFESCFFGRPVFAREGAHFAKDVKAEALGMCIATADIAEVIAQIRSITPTQLANWEQNMYALPREKYVYTEESSWLASAILQLAGRSPKSTDPTSKTK